MCGLFAVLSLSGPIREDYSRNLEMIAHRGPDDSGSALLSIESGPEGGRSDRVWLGHQRLSIIDPDPRGAQPMTTPDRRYTMVFNGEIYNYVELRRECVAAGWSFSTETDSEVLLACWALWGERALERFVGMFAFVMVDRAIGKVWLARDAFGIKPLHYAWSDDRLFVSSEIPALIATGKIPIDLDPLQSLEYIRFGASPAVDKTLIEGITRLPLASVACFDFTTGELSKPKRYWKPSRGERRISFADAVSECRARFLDNVRLHLRSDVPVGAALSGGLDSSAIVCAINHLEPDLRLNTFSFISAEEHQSEEKWVDIVNQHIGAKAHKVRPQPADLGDDLDALVQAQGEPFGSASIYAQFRVFRMAREAGVPVTLDGQGADEVLAGYWPYLGTRGAELMRRGRIDLALRLVWNSAADMKTRARLAALLVQDLSPDAFKAGFRRLIGRELIPAFISRDWLASNGVDEHELMKGMIATHKDLRSHLVDTVERSSLPTLLRIADRSSMAFSVESRVPFLTTGFVDFLLELPPDYVISPDGERKHVFREAMKGILPEPVRIRRDKIGFFADDGAWLRHNQDRFMSYLDDVRALPLFQSDEVERAIGNFYCRREGSAQQIWRIFIFAIWLRQMRSLQA